MRRGPLYTLLIGGPILALAVYIGINTEWKDVTVPMPPQGEALTNPFYAAQRFTEALGARAVRDRVLMTPPRNAVLVLSAWHWDLSPTRREAIERWVESGGRLVVDSTLTGSQDAFERWSGIHHTKRKSDDDAIDTLFSELLDQCEQYTERNTETASDEVESEEKTPASVSLCHVDQRSSLNTASTAMWTLRDSSRTQALRVQVGRGHVTVINAAPFREQALFKGDHGRIFVAATELRRGDEVHFLSEDVHLSLLAMIWRYGGPVVVLSLALIGLLLWRGAVRFGPLVAPIPGARRSLAEQIRGTGQFAMRQGDSDALFNACVRALEETVQRRVKGYTTMPGRERASVLARLSGLNRKALGNALHDPDSRRPQELRRTIALLEMARRHILITQRRSSHGTR
jgi:hypothetical protein